MFAVRAVSSVPQGSADESQPKKSFFTGLKRVFRKKKEDDASSRKLTE